MRNCGYMFKYILTIRFFLLLLPLFLISCNTYFWQPVCKLIVGKWVMSPNPTDAGVTEKWEFKSDGCLVITNHDPNTNELLSTQVFLTSKTDTSLTSCIEFNCKNGLGKDFVETPRWFLGDNASIGVNNDVGKWLVVRINKAELYLSAQVENSSGQTIKGYFQRGFIRE